jgi:hypothetical protein
MKKNLVALMAVLGFCVGQPAHGGIGFGIPLPFPFLVWTPSGHCGQGPHGSCGPTGRDRTSAIPAPGMAHIQATTQTRPASAAKAAIGLSGVAVAFALTPSGSKNKVFP